MGVGFLEPLRFMFFANANPVTPKNIWRTPPIMAAVGFLALIWKRSGNWEARKSQIEIVSLSGFHQASLRHTHLGDPHVPSKYSRKHHRDYLSEHWIFPEKVRCGNQADLSNMIHQQMAESRWKRGLSSYLGGVPAIQRFDLCLAFVAGFTNWKKKQRYVYIHHTLGPQKPWKTKVLNPNVWVITPKNEGTVGSHW